MIRFCQPSVGRLELEAIGDVFAGSWLGNGPVTASFEAAFAERIGRPASEVVAVSSCTEGLFQAFAALDLGPGDEVVLPSVSFVGAAHAVRSTGAQVVLCDVDPSSLNPTPEHVERALSPSTRAVCVLHFGGAPGSVAELAWLAVERGVALVEDAALATGSTSGGRACGTFGSIGVWSFDAMKTMTTGDGGLMWIRDSKLADRVRTAIRMGVGSSGWDRRGSAGAWWEIDPLAPGRRATMNDLSAAIGMVQLGRLDEFLARRAEVAASYDEALGGLPWLRPLAARPAGAAWTYYGVRTSPARRDRLARHLLDRDVYANFRYWPLHRMGLYASNVALPGADRAAQETLLLPLHPALSDAEVDQVVESVTVFPA